MAITIFEGPDCCGKTTLIKELTRDRETKSWYIYTGSRFMRCIPAYHTAIARKAIDLSNDGYDVYIDRLWPSEYVYAGVYRNGTPWPFFGKTIERILPENTSYVYCIIKSCSTYMDIMTKELAQGRAELYTSNIRKVWDEYRALIEGVDTLIPVNQRPTHFEYLKMNGGVCNTNPNNTFVYDWTDPNNSISDVRGFLWR